MQTKKGVFGIGAVLVVSLLVLTLGLTGCGLFGDDIENPDNGETADSVVDELQGIVVLCNSPDSGLDPATRSSLIDKIKRAETAYLSTQPCSAIPILNEYLQQVQTLRSTATDFEQLYQMGQEAISGIELKYDCGTIIPQ